MANDIDKLVLDYLKGNAGESHHMDVGVTSGLFRDCEKLKGTQKGRDLGAAIARRIADPDPELRYQALVFLAGVESFESTRAALPFVRGDRALFRGIFPSEGGDKDLEWWLLRVLNKLISTDDEARELAKKEALDPNGRAAVVMARLSKVDPDWVRAHRDVIERTHPDTKDPIASNLA